eukprot:3747057-Amphidinium_carterae.1
MALGGLKRTFSVLGTSSGYAGWSLAQRPVSGVLGQALGMARLGVTSGYLLPVSGQSGWLFLPVHGL